MIYSSPSGLVFSKNSDKLSTPSQDQHWDSSEIEIPFPPRRRGFTTIGLSIVPLFGISTRIEQCNKKLNGEPKKGPQMYHIRTLLELAILTSGENTKTSIEGGGKHCLSTW